MEITRLVDLKEKLFIRSTLLSIGSLDEILGLNDFLTADQVILEIVKKALREFELTCPLILEMKMNRNQMGNCYMEGWGEIKSNFTLWLDCIIGEDQIILVPNSLPQWRVASYSFPMSGAYTFFTEYKRPYIFIGDLPSSEEFYIRGLCSRPIIPDFKEDKTFNEASNKSAIYWMNIEDAGARSVYFVDLCMCHLLDYIRQLKASITLPSMSVDVLGNVDSAYQELRARCDQFVMQSGWYGELLL